MKTKNKEVVKTQSEKTTKKDSATLKAIENSLDKKRVERDAKRTTTTKIKNFIYTFERLNVSDKDSKKLRSKIRRERNNLLNAILLEKKDNRENIKNFISFYKKNYILNDFSIKSFTNSQDELLIEDINRVVKIIQTAKENTK